MPEPLSIILAFSIQVSGVKYAPEIQGKNCACATVTRMDNLCMVERIPGSYWNMIVVLNKEKLPTTDKVYITCLGDKG